MGEDQGFHKIGMDSDQGFQKIGMDLDQAIKLRKRRRLCFIISFFFLLSLAIVAIVLSQTIFKLRDPRVSLNNVKVQNISVNISVLSTLLSVRVAADVRVDNPNYYDFTYDNSTVLLMYQEKQVGDVELGAGTIRSRKVVEIPAVITVEAVKILLAGLQDLSDGVASVVLDAVIPGRVNLANVYKKNVTARLNCDVDIFIGNQTVKHNNCKQTIQM